MTYPILALVAVTLTAGNFLYQALGGQHWDVAYERSWFQATALLSVGLVEAIRRRI